MQRLGAKQQSTGETPAPKLSTLDQDREDALEKEKRRHQQLQMQL